MKMSGLRDSHSATMGNLAENNNSVLLRIASLFSERKHGNALILRNELGETTT